MLFCHSGQWGSVQNRPVASTSLAAIFCMVGKTCE